MLVFATETSCDETSVCIMDKNKHIYSHIVFTQETHKRHGGVVPELASRAHRGIYLGLAPNHKSHLFWNLETNRILPTYSVRVVESVMPFKQRATIYRRPKDNVNKIVNIISDNLNENEECVPSYEFSRGKNFNETNNNETNNDQEEGNFKNIFENINDQSFISQLPEVEDLEENKLSPELDEVQHDKNELKEEDEDNYIQENIHQNWLNEISDDSEREELRKDAILEYREALLTEKENSKKLIEAELEYMKCALNKRLLNNYGINTTFLGKTTRPQQTRIISCKKE